MSRNIYKLYKYSGKCNNQQQYKSILEAEMFYTTEGFTKNSPILPGPSVTVKKSSSRKPIHKFSEELYVKKNTVIYILYADKSNLK